MIHSYSRSGTNARSRPAENDVGPTGQRSLGLRGRGRALDHVDQRTEIARRRIRADCRR